MITSDQLIKAGVSTSNAAKYIVAINAALARFEINTKLRICHFLSQLLHESGFLQVMSENLNYSAEGLLKTFHTHFTPESAAQYAHHNQAIANHVYAGRYGNGDENSGDGWRYHGRGGFQVTFKDNYAAQAKQLGLDLVNHPESLELPENSMLSAGLFWSNHSLNHLADLDNAVAVRRMVNGGTIGLPETTELVTKLKGIIA